MTLGIDVILQNQIVFIIGDFVGQLEVSRLKTRLEHECPIIRTLGHVIVSTWEGYWLTKLPLLFEKKVVTILKLQYLFYVACPYKLIEVIRVKLLIRCITLLSES